MIKVQIRECKGEVLSVTLTGHAGYAEEGEDIICSAVSMLAINTANAIEAFTEDAFTVDEGGGDGYLKISVDPGSSPETIVLMKAFKLGLISIPENYGDTYIKIVTKEVKSYDEVKPSAVRS